ncbi:MAG TPA: outer membrane protein assembly factor BamD [Gemmatimonadaceae bacterium]|nr:outer membrane protein assembly factor BamD [Gemmatimonadaceae bacterium]
MTMRILLTAAAIISSAGYGVSHSPTSHASIHPSIAPLAAASVDAQLGQAFASLDQQDNPLPPEPWAKADPADSLYRLAREAMSRGDYKRAADIFHSIPERYPQSAYAGQSLYFEAYSLYRVGGDEDLATARDRLKLLKQRYPAIAKKDGDPLLTRVCGELAKRGDEPCAASIGTIAEGDSDVTGRATRTTPGSQGRNCSPDADEDSDDRIAALNALLQMDADRAMPILQKVLARRDPCSVALRRKAVFLVSQKRTDQTANILMSVARGDPDQEVREQAVFWLSQVPGSTGLLEEILKGNGDENIKEKALFSLSQQNEPKAQQILRDFAAREGENPDLREKAIFWLGQRRSTENTEFLRNLYSRLTNEDLKEKILFSLSQQKEAGNEQWLMNIAVNPKEGIELRKKALFWAGQSGVPIAEMSKLYDRMNDAEMKEQIIFVLSQRQHDPAAIDKMFDIAKNEKDAELRKKAIFWLGQSRDPRVQQFLMDLINK